MGITKRHHKIAIFNYKKREHNFTIIIYILKHGIKQNTTYRFFSITVD